MDLSGKNFCISGLIGEEEKLVKSAIEKRGGIVRSSVVKDLDYLIYHGQFGVGTKKFVKAQELISSGCDVKMIEVKNFIELLK